MLFRAAGFIKVEGYSREKFIPDDNGLLMIFRHPSMKEVVILPVIMLPAYLRHLERVPFQTPDKDNYYDPWFMKPFRQISIPVRRSSKIAAGRSLVGMLRHLNVGGVLLVAAEGGRTWKAKQLRTIDGDLIPTPEGGVDLQERVVRTFAGGIENLAEGRKVLPIWVEPRWKVGLRIVIGEQQTCNALNSEERQLELEMMMLRAGT